ncbi:hypothetical protein [Croceibacterium aestuarii]|uniref:hypothetical protein n=1 Tax=Croceibacterium aestuarii TaxID=3064139 RepID=UPI00272E1076|nr:hypothetical protein [Croceibacterium sp. D39]
MKLRYISAALAVISTAAAGQVPGWNYYEPGDGTIQAVVVAADGAQFILKCDKPGKREVVGIVANTAQLARPLPDGQFETQPVAVRLDGGAPYDDRWRFNDRFAMALNKGNERSLDRLLIKLVDADTMELRLKPSKQPMTVLTFDHLAGAREAIERVFNSCKDEVPFD